MNYYATVNGETVLVTRASDGVVVGEHPVAFGAEPIGDGDAYFRMSDSSERVRAARVPGGWRVRIGSREWTVELETERARAIRELTGHEATALAPDLKAPMPGLVVKVLVGPGDTVASGDGLVVVEAMKMENELRAQREAVVSRVAVTAGDTVDRDEVLIEFEADE